MIMLFNSPYQRPNMPVMLWIIVSLCQYPADLFYIVIACSLLCHDDLFYLGKLFLKFIRDYLRRFVFPELNTYSLDQLILHPLLHSFLHSLFNSFQFHIHKHFALSLRHQSPNEIFHSMIKILFSVFTHLPQSFQHLLSVPIFHCQTISPLYLPICDPPL